jgi:hypothetical protein
VFLGLGLVEFDVIRIWDSLGLVLGAQPWFCHALCIPVATGLQSKASMPEVCAAVCLKSLIQKQPLGRK